LYWSVAAAKGRNCWPFSDELNDGNGLVSGTSSPPPGLPSGPLLALLFEPKSVKRPGKAVLEPPQANDTVGFTSSEHAEKSRSRCRTSWLS